MFSVQFGTFFFFCAQKLLNRISAVGAVYSIAHHAPDNQDHLILQALRQIDIRYMGAISLDIWHTHKPTHHAAFV